MQDDECYLFSAEEGDYERITNKQGVEAIARNEYNLINYREY
jgi:hypothetical protein